MFGSVGIRSSFWRHGRGALLAALLATALLAAVFGRMPAASAGEKGAPGAAVHGTGLRIVSPAKDSLVAARKVRLQVRGAGHGQVRIFNGGERLRVRPGKPRHGMRTARLRRGRDLHRGTNVISVRSGNGFDQRRFVLGRKRSGLLSVRRAPRRSHRGPQRVRVGTALPVDGFRARLNGRRVDDAFDSGRPRRRSAALNASHGLRFGRNRLVVLAYRGDGRYDREVRHFVIDRSHPLAGAGRDRAVKAGRAMRLNGRSSRPSRRGRRLRYSWRVVSGPHRGRVKLRGAHSARPRLISSRPGRYRVRLTVRQAGSGHRKGPSGRFRVRAAAAAAAGRSSSDGATVTVRPALPPIGARITTLYDGPGGQGVKVGGRVYQRPDAQQTGPQLLMLDRKTLVEDKRAEAGFNFDDGGWKMLAERVSEMAKSDQGDLVILSGGDSQVSCDSNCAKTVKGFIGELGGSWTSGLDYKTALKNGAWSLIGVPGSSPGSATQNFYMEAGTSIGLGGLEGYLQPDNFQNFKYVSDQYEPFDTSVPGQPAGRNLIRVAGHSYASDPTEYAPGASGFQVLSLYQRDLSLYDNETFWTNDRSGAVQPDAVRSMAGSIDSAGVIGITDPLLVIVQSIGAPSPGGTNWQSWEQNIPEAIGAVGGTPEVLRNFNLDGEGTHSVAHHIGSHPGGYTLVGGTDLPGYGTEQTFWYSGQPARLHGILTRDSGSQFEVAHSGAAGAQVSASAGLSRVAYRPPTPWPASSTPGERAANAFLTHRLGYQQIDDLRIAYYEDDSADWAASVETLSQVGYPGGSSGFSRADFGAVKTELESEMEMVAQVRKLIGDYKSDIFGSGSEGKSLVDLQSISHQIESAVGLNGSEGASSTARAEEITGLLLGVAGEAGDLYNPAIGLALNAAAAGFEIAGTVSDDEQGNPLPGKVATRADQLGVELADRYQTITDSLDHVGDLLVSDYGKLKAADAAALNQWKLNTTNTEVLQNALETSSKRWVYGALMPVAYGLYTLNGPYNTGSRLWLPYYYRCYSFQYDGDGNYSSVQHNRFEDANWSTYYASRADTGLWHPQILSTEIDFTDSTNQYLSNDNDNATPPTWLTERMFNLPTQGNDNLGLNQPTFFSRNSFDRIPVNCKGG